MDEFEVLSIEKIDEAIDKALGLEHQANDLVHNLCSLVRLLRTCIVSRDNEIELLQARLRLPVGSNKEKK